MKRPIEIAKPSWILTLASIAVVVAALYLAKGVLIPLTLAVLLSFLLSPLCDWLERGRLSRIPAVLVTAALGFTVLGVAGWTAAVQMSHLAPKIPQYQDNLEAKLQSVNSYAAGALSMFSKTAESVDEAVSPAEEVQAARGTSEFPFSVRVLSSPASPLQVFGGMFGTLLEVLGTTGIVVVLVVFFLIRREDLRDRFIRLVGADHATLTTQMLEDAGARVSRYLSMLFVINATYGVAVGLGLSLIGVPSAILWGILAAVLRFIPYIGPWIAAAMPIGLAMAISTGWTAPLLTIALFVVLELISNNVMEPWLYGKKTGVSAVAVLVAAVFWMWLWGPVGLLLATPLTVCLLVVGKHIPDLSFLNTLLGTDPVFEPKNRIYQRLLAGDQEEAVDLLDEYLRRQPLAEVYDTVLIPALALAETHWQLGELNDAKHKFIMQSLKEMLQDRGERRQEKQAQQDADQTSPAPEADDEFPLAARTQSRRLNILCLPARSEADEIAALLLAQILESSDCLVQALPATSTAGEMADLVERRQPDVVCISATPPAAVMHAGYLCRQLRNRFPHLSLVVGLWDAQGDLSKSRERIGCSAAVAATLAAAQVHIRQMAPALPRREQHAPSETTQPVETGAI
ncbi:MAG: AI-2E family transporter [Planctomycetes bacterium]|nr:AI-2E family transporter [Planctomycetota bacterium]